jgi:hypothetical protein
MSVTNSTNFGNGWVAWACPVNLVLASIYKMANPQLTGYNTGFMASLLSEENMMNAPQKLNANGPNQIRIAYSTRPLEASVSEVKMVPCADQAESVRKESNLTLDLYSSAGWKMNLNSFLLFCKEFSEVLPRLNQILEMEKFAPIINPSDMNNVLNSQNAMLEMLKMMPGTMANINSLIATQNALRANMNKQLVKELYADFIGSFAGPAPISATPLGVDIITAANGALVHKGFQDIIFEYQKAMRNGMPIVVGFNLLQRALSSFSDYCCNEMGSPLNPMATAGSFAMKYWADQYVNVVANGASTTEDFIVYEPGALALFTRNDNAEINGVTLGTVTHGIVPDVQYPSLTYDYSVDTDGCTKEINFNLGIQYGLWGMLPAETYAVGDVLAGVNGVFQFTAQAI